MHPQPHIRPTIPATDLDRARRFYEQTLGFSPGAMLPEGIQYQGADGTGFLLFPSTGKASGTHTQVSFGVPDVEATARELKGKGIELERVDMPGTDPETRITTIGDVRVGWFRDTEGNLLAISDEVSAAS